MKKLSELKYKKINLINWIIWQLKFQTPSNQGISIVGRDIQYSIFNINPRGEIDSTFNINLKGDIHPRVFDPEVSCFNAMTTLWLSGSNVESILRWSVVETPVTPSGASVDISLWMSTGKVESPMSDAVLGFGPWGLNKMSKEWDLKMLEVGEQQ